MAISLKSTHAFQIKRTTAAGVDYFVDRSFSRYLRDSRAIFQIESQVDQVRQYVCCLLRV